MKRILVVACLAMVLGACAKKGPEQKGGPFLAKVGNAVITEADFDKELQSLPDYAQQMFQGGEGREKLLDNIINKEVLYQEAVKKGLDKTPEFTKKIEDLKKDMLAQEIFKNEILDKVQVTDQEVKDYYEKKKEDLTTISQIRASHILVKTEADAQKAVARLAKGEKFADVARSLSIDKASGKEGGDLGYFGRGQMAPEIERAAAGLKIGEVSEPIKTQAGFEIIKVTDKKKGPVIEFERIKDRLRQNLLAEKQKELFDKYLAGLKSAYKIEINKELLAKPAEGNGRPGTEQAPEKKAAPEGGKKAGEAGGKAAEKSK
jgi:peptidyl-prolyl cis-trans isomerase C